MIKNAKTEPKIYYGLHMVPGLAEYRSPGEEPHRILIQEQACKNMDPSYAGKPLYVDHVDEVNLGRIKEEADGYVVESFFNKPDGRHWAKFIVVGDAAHDAIQKGWRLSNAYKATEKAAGGLWHGVDYDEEIKSGVYDHLAIVKVPRYDESIILTPEEFKEYNERKERELETLTNELEGDYSMLKFFKRTKVENSADYENVMVVLPKSNKEYSIADLVKNADDMEAKKNQPMMANDDHMVEIGNEKMSVNELKQKYAELKDSKKNDDMYLEKEEKEQLKNEDEEEKKENEEKKDDEEKKIKKNEDQADAEAKADLKKNALETKKKRFNEISKAHLSAQVAEVPNVECSIDQLARGKSRYGS